MIQVSNVNKSFGKHQILRNISIDVESGEQVVLHGASGSGKSTLLYLIGALERADSGTIFIDGQDITRFSDDGLAYFRNTQIGLVFQFHFLLHSMSALDNILLPAQIGNHSIKKVKSFIMELAKFLNITHLLNKYPYELSGGEQQRINLLRAISLKPKTILADEPTGNLDSKNSSLVMDLLQSLCGELSSTLLVVTHDLKMKERFNRKITIEDGQIIS